MTGDAGASGPPPGRPAAAEQILVPPGVWIQAVQDRDLPSFDPAAHRRVVVVAAHPDDETLGAGGVLQAMHAAGTKITLVVATDGEAAYPALGPVAREDLARARRAELGAALHAQGLGAVAVHWLGLPDSGLFERVDLVRQALVPMLADSDAFLAPWPGDPHPDHRAAGLAAAAAAPATSHGWSYLIWTWAWTSPDDPALPWDRAYVVKLDAAARAARGAAVACFVSQVGPGPDGSAPVLAAGLLDHADRDADLLFREPRTTSAPVDRFTALYAGGNDPWNAGSWYERRKRAAALASLPQERYRTAFEPGCGTGELTAELGERCAQVLASDPVIDAVERARGLTRHLPGVQVEVAELPDAVPTEPLDLAVFSEVLYYLDDAALSATLDSTLAALRPGGDVVVVHWRGWPPEAPRDAAATHGVLAARPELDLLVEHTDQDFLLHVLRRR